MIAGIGAGFDLGGTQLKYGLVRGDGAVLFKDQADSPEDLRGLLDLLRRLWLRLKAESPGPVDACGFGFPGFYDQALRRMLHSPNYPALDGFEPVPALREFIDVPFLVDNDANLAAYGEYLYGSGRTAQSLVLLTIGTGIGSGIILEGRLWEGKCGFAGELGHITVNPDGYLCACGNFGCLEAQSAAPAILRYYRELTGTAGELTTRDLHQLAAGGDAAARRAFAKAAYYLGIGLGIIMNFLNPEMIVLGGGVMAAGKLLSEPAVEESVRRSHRVSFACCRIVEAALGNDAGFMGAAGLARASRRKPAP